jgi:hypothetical protein
MYISITGLKPKGVWGLVRFWTLAIPSFSEAKSAKGNLNSAVKKINGYNCTLSAWENRESMLAFMKNGVHLKAMKAFNAIATGRTYGYESDTIPSWEDAYSILETKGKNYT